jgi:hypothetical protein
MLMSQLLLHSAVSQRIFGRRSEVRDENASQQFAAVGFAAVLQAKVKPAKV